MKVERIFTSSSHYWISYLGYTYVVDYCSTIILDKKVLEMRILNEYTKSDNGI